VHEKRKALQTEYKAELREYDAASEGRRVQIRKAKDEASSGEELKRALVQIEEESPLGSRSSLCQSQQRKAW
jgi:hypothetical protein